MALHETNRRAFLSAGVAAVAALAGCVNAVGLDGDPNRHLRLTLTRHDGPLRDRHVVDLSETRPEWSEEAFEAALDGSTYTTQHRRPFFSTPDDPRYAERDGTYYLLGSTVVDEVAETRPVLRLYGVDGDDDDPPPNGVSSDELPEGDQHAVQIAHMAARARDDEGGVPWGLVERGGYVYRHEDAVESSRLLSGDGPDHVEFRERWWAVSVSRETFHEPVYRATAEPVASSPERMEAILRARLVDARLDRDDLSAEARDVLVAAEGEGYAEEHPYSSAYRAVLRGLDERAFLDGDVENDAYTDELGYGTLLYDGEYFTYRLRFRSESD